MLERIKVKTAAPWPWVDPDRPFVLPTLVPLGKLPPRPLADAVRQVKVGMLACLGASATCHARLAVPYVML